MPPTSRCAGWRARCAFRCPTVCGWTTSSNATYSYIEFILTTAGGRYRDASDGSTAGNVLSFTDNTKLTFDVLGPMPSNPALAAGDSIVVYNLGPGYAPADAYTAPAPAGIVLR